MQIQPAAEKEALHEGQDGAVGIAEIDRRSHDDSVGLRKLRRGLVDEVVEDAFPGLLAATAGDTAADGLVAHEHLFGLDALRVQDLRGLLEGGADTALRIRAAVDHQYLHTSNSSFRSIIPRISACPFSR